MKKTIFGLFLIALLSVSCGSKKNNEKESSLNQEKEKSELVKEINSNDSVSTEIEEIKTEIEEASNKLDTLISNL
ncbi:MAG: hypothetical protein ABFS16_07610 [Bacteroidota bacterium]